MKKQISNRKLQKLNKRQRKKRGVGQFQRNFFEIWVQYTHDLSPSENRIFLEAYQNKIKDMELISIFGSSIKPSSSAGVVSVDAKHGSPTEDQKKAIIGFINGLENVQSVEAGDML